MVIKQMSSLRELHLHDHIPTALLAELITPPHALGQLEVFPSASSSPRNVPEPVYATLPKLHSLDGAGRPSFWPFLARLTNLTALKLRGGWDLPQGEPTVEQLAALARALRSCSMLKELRMEHWKTQLLAHLSDADLFTFWHALLRGVPAVTKLSLHICRANGVLAALSMPQSAPALTTLDLRHCDGLLHADLSHLSHPCLESLYATGPDLKIHRGELHALRRSPRCPKLHIIYAF
jgi:hypothetical protein